MGGRGGRRATADSRRSLLGSCCCSCCCLRFLKFFLGCYEITAHRATLFPKQRGPLRELAWHPLVALHGSRRLCLGAILRTDLQNEGESGKKSSPCLPMVHSDFSSVSISHMSAPPLISLPVLAQDSVERRPSTHPALPFAPVPRNIRTAGAAWDGKVEQ